MRAYWHAFCRVLLGMLARPMWMMMLISLSVMSLVYVHNGVWDLPVGVIDQDHSPASRLLIRHLDAAPKLSTRIYANLPQAQHDLGRRKLFAIIIIPPDLEEKVLHSAHTVIPVFGDATNRLANGQIQQNILSAYQELMAAYNSMLLQKQGFTLQQTRVLLSPVEGQLQALFNSGISFAAITFPGLLVMLMQHSLLISCVRVSLQLRSLPGVKLSLPVYLGGLSALLPIWLFLSIVMFVLWPWVLGYRQTASIVEILLLTFPFLLAVMGLGKLVTECLRRVEWIYLTLAFLTTPVFYISGTIWPLQSMPAWVRGISSILPSTWAAKMIAGVNQMGLALSDVWFDVLMLLLLGGIYTALGIGVGMLRDSQRLRTLLSC